MRLPHSYLDDLQPDGTVVVTLPKHVPSDVIEGAIERITQTDFGERAAYIQEGNRIKILCNPVAFADSAAEHLVDVIRAIVMDRYTPRPLPDGD